MIQDHLIDSARFALFKCLPNTNHWYEILPKNGGNTNRGHNLNMVKAMLRVGVVPQVLNVRGTHGSHRQERFVFLAGLVTSVMSGPAFDTADSRASTWASLKGAAQPDAAANGAAR